MPFPKSVSGRERKGRKERDKDMEGTGDVSVEPQDQHGWSVEKVATFARALGPAQQVSK